MKSLRRALAAALLPLALLVPKPAPAQAQGNYPDRPITLVVGFSPGSSIDLVARTVAKQLGSSLRQPVLVENKPGAGGNVAAEAVARARPDGHTLLVVANSVAISPAMYPSQSFDAMRDLSAIAFMGIGPVILKVSKSSGIDSVRDLVARAKASPGKLNYGSSGEGGTPHMATVLFEPINGISMTHVPYKGGGDALTALMGGQIDLLINPLLGDVKSDRIASLAITGNDRSPLSPEVPTFRELGYDFNVGVYYGLMGPKGLPVALIDQVNRSVNEALADPAVLETLTRRSGIVMTAMSPGQFHDYLLRDMELWRQVVARRGR